MDYNFFLIFILAHLIGDFTLQTNYIAKLKAESSKGLLLHCTIVTIVQTGFLSFFGIQGTISGLVSGIFHYAIDFMKGKLNKYLVRKQFIYFIFDQLIHGVIIWVIVSKVSPEVSVFSRMDNQIKLVIALVTVTYVSTVAAKILMRDIYHLPQNPKFFSRYERAYDAATAIIVLSILFLPKPFFMLVPLLVFIYYRFQSRLYGFSFSQTCTKFAVLMSMSTIVFFFVKFL